MNKSGYKSESNKQFKMEMKMKREKYKEVKIDFKKLRKVRIGKGVSLREAAKGIGMSFSYLFELERGTCMNLSFAVMCKISRYYGVGLDYFVT